MTDFLGHTALIGIGSNIGDRLVFCQKAVDALSHHPEIRITRISSLYETEPVDFLKQDRFYNAVLAVQTSLSPKQLLRACQKIEGALGKKITVAKGPRTVDLDLLFFEDLDLVLPDLVLPHPEITRRLFVLIPLAEIAGHWVHPHTACSVEILLQGFQPEQLKTVDLRFEAGWEKISATSRPL